jgi:hypothetical protein
VSSPITPTFVTRQNTQGDYGDNFQDFWLTATQRDWSLGEQQRYFRQGNDDAIRRYWVGSNVNVNLVQGHVSMRRDAPSVTLGSTPANTNFGTDGSSVFYSTSTNLRQVGKDRGSNLGVTLLAGAVADADGPH